MTAPTARKPDPISRHVWEFQRRLPAFERARVAEQAGLRTDLTARLLADYLLFGDKTAYDSMLQSMLTPSEHERLATDREFTQAWRSFVDLCWLKKQAIRAAIIVLGLALLLGLVAFLIHAFPQTWQHTDEVAPQ